MRKPDSVPAFALSRYRRAAAITLCGLPGQKNWSVPAGSNPFRDTFRHMPSIWPCSWRGLQCRFPCGKARWALTPPFHPCPSAGSGFPSTLKIRERNLKPADWRYIFCCTIRHAALIPARPAFRRAPCSNRVRTFLREIYSVSLVYFSVAVCTGVILPSSTSGSAL